MLRIAKGNIVERTPAVHGHTLEEDEEKVLIFELINGECTHPEYSNLFSGGGRILYIAGREFISKNITQYGSTVYIGMALVWPAL